MGKLLMPAALFRSVANQVPQLSQPATTLRQCDSCPYPFRDRAPTVALSLSDCWRGKRGVAKEHFAAAPIVSAAWGFRAGPQQGEATGPDQKLPKSQINVLSASMWLQVDGGLSPEAGKHQHRCHSAVRTEIKNQDRPIAFQACARAQRVGSIEQSGELEFDKNAPKLAGRGCRFKCLSRPWERHRIGNHAQKISPNRKIRGATVTRSNVEKSSIDWKEIRGRYEGEPCSIRALAREHNTSDTAIHRRAKSDRWKLFSTNSAPQQRVQRPERPARPWSFETRRDALVTGLERMRASVDNAEDSYHCDALVVQALLWFRTPVAEIARAIEITEVGLEEIYGVQIFKHWRDVCGIKLGRNAQRRVERAERAPA